MAMTPERRKRRMTAKEGAAMLGKSERSVQRLVAQERGEWIEEQRQRRLAMLEMYEADEETTWKDVARAFKIEPITAYQHGARARKERAAAEREKIEPPLPLEELRAS
jgi:hypothetical protein